MNVQYSGGLRSFAKEMRTLKMRSTVANHQNVTAINWVDHWIWSYYNHMQNCQRTQCWPFYVYSAFEANWNHEKAQLVGASWADQKLKKKNSFKNVVFSYSTQQKANHFLIGLWYVMKSGSGTTANDNQLSGYTEKKLQNTSQSQSCTRKGHGHYLVVCAHLIHYTFLNPSKTITSEKYAQQIRGIHRKLQHLQLALVSRMGPILLNSARHTSHNQHFRSWMNRTVKFYLIHHIHLTSRQLTTTSSSISTTFCRENTSTTSRRQKMLSKSSLNPKAQIFMLQE